MTYKQSVKLKEMGFPRNEGEWFYDSDGEFLSNPTAEETLEWVESKLGNGIMIIPQTEGYDISYRCIFDKKNNNTLSDAVYALIVWCYENKLLEGK